MRIACKQLQPHSFWFVETLKKKVVIKTDCIVQGNGPGSERWCVE